MSKIKFRCFNCDSKIEAEDKYIGRKGKCPKCGAKNTVPSMHDTVEENIIKLFKDIDDYEEESEDKKDIGLDYEE